MGREGELGIIKIIFENDIIDLKISMYSKGQGRLVKEISKRITGYERVVVHDNIVIPKQMGKKEYIMVTTGFNDVKIDKKTVFIK